MKKTILIFFTLLLIFTLSACVGKGSVNESATANGDSPAVDAADRQFEMPLETKLVLGTVKLDETDHAVDAEQASQLLPLWKALRSLGESETAAQAEIDAVISQIEDTMTEEQMDAIEAMQLTQADMTSVAEILGVEMGGFGGEMTEEMRATMEAMRESGNFQPPGGDIPGGGMGPGGGQGPGGGFGGQGGQMDPAARETAMAERGGTRGARSGINTALLDGIIAFLDAKIQE